VLGDQSVGDTFLGKPRRDTGGGPSKRLRRVEPGHRALIREQDIRDVVHQDRHADLLDRLELDLSHFGFRS
jgi:hypothetical protein